MAHREMKKGAIGVRRSCSSSTFGLGELPELASGQPFGHLGMVAFELGDAVAALTEPVTDFLWRPRLRDPADEMGPGSGR